MAAVKDALTGGGGLALEVDVAQGLVVEEDAVAQLRQACGQGQAVQLPAVRQGKAADPRQALGQLHLGQIRQAGEGVVADPGDALQDPDLGDLIRVGVPGLGSVHRVVFHRALAEDGQDAAAVVLLKTPVYGLAAVVGAERTQSNVVPGAFIVRCPGVGIGDRIIDDGIC